MHVEFVKDVQCGRYVQFGQYLQYVHLYLVPSTLQLVNTLGSDIVLVTNWVRTRAQGRIQPQIEVVVHAVAVLFLLKSA